MWEKCREMSEKLIKSVNFAYVGNVCSKKKTYNFTLPHLGCVLAYTKISRPIKKNIGTPNAYQQSVKINYAEARVGAESHPRAQKQR